MGLTDELEGTLVVSLEQAVAAPYCGLLLADAGARVIKVERPEGDFARGYDVGADGQSAIFIWLNRGKESICLNLKDRDDMAVLRAILREADILLSNLAPGALDRLGLVSDELRIDNPGLICCAISGYGDEGDAARKKAYDFLVQAECAICSVTGSAEAPARVGVSIADLSTGLTAFSALLRALLQRAKTGRGIDLKISMFDVLADWMNMPLLAHRYLGGAPARSGLKHSLIAPYGAFDCGDGGQVLISVQSNREFATLCEQVLEQPQLSTDPRFADNPQRCANRLELDAIVNAAFARHDRATVLARLDAAQIANASLNSVQQLSEHPFLRECSASMAGAVIDLAALPVRTDKPTSASAPPLGADGARIRSEFAHSRESMPTPR